MWKIRQTINFLIPVIVITALLVVLAGCQSQEGTRNMEAKNKAFINTYTDDFWNNHNIAAFDTYFSADFIVHSAMGDQNREQYKGLCQAYFASFPDLHITTDDLIAEGDKVTKAWTANCTHKADFMGIPATEKSIVVKGIEVFRITDGKISELWACMDNLGMMQQLGVIPPMGE